ncbi:MAG: FtsW/RodA/SpoVE family cell cycle protein [Actinobacteria bacterium]|nr:FtsW/RodA/SpoVE family cell cycle protein [Actinomycetota bacterium]
MTTYAPLDLQRPRERRWDLLLIGAALAAGVLGLVMVYTATSSGLAVLGLTGSYFLKRQAVFLVLSIVAMLFIMRLDYRRYESFAYGIYGLVVLSLLAVMSPIGSSSLGASRWFALGPLRIQPSEFAVLGMILVTATIGARNPEGLSWRTVGLILGLTSLPAGLILLQPDMGTAIILLISTLAMLLALGVPVRFVLGLVALGILAMYLAVQIGFLHHYQVMRLTSFLHQNTTDPQMQQYVYNVNQAKAAIGSGGLFGSGIGQGSQTNLGYVPEQQTDFIFTAVGEQLGFFGATAVLALLALVASRILRAAFVARDQVGRVICVGVFTFFGFSVFENAGMTMGIMPVTGIPLPFFSYGGSALLCFFMAIGIVVNVFARRNGA